ncbi:MAG: hypothetical protein E7070_00540 [Bacteroidales bacterium]|jgi:hypothetical protein|nr:hypothetical protein [Bacteroidales bacterium]
MKKLFSLFVAAMTLAAMTITSCEDVPAPYEVNLSGSGSSSSSDDATATGSGTLADPYSVTKVCALVSAGTLSSTTYAYVSGRVSQFDSISLQYGNAYYYISLDGSLTGKQLQVYRGYYTGGNKFTSNDQALQVGDSVVIYGTYQLYSSKYEINSGSKIAYLNGTSYDVAEVTTDVTGTPSGNGTLESPYNTAAALKLIYAGNAPSDKVYVQGRVCASDLSVDTSSYGNATYYISANGSSTDRLEVYRGYGLGGNKFTSADELQAGDSVIVYGTLVYYNNKTPEFTSGSSIVYRNGETASTGGGSTGGGESSDGTITFDFSANCFNVTSEKTTAETTYTYNGYSCTLTAATAFYFQSSGGYLMLGKSGSTLTLSGFTSTVAKIEVVGTSGASASVKQNIYVGDVAVSTETVGAQNVTNSYIIADAYRNQSSYTLKVTSSHNTQISKIIIYSEAESSDVEPTVDETPTYSFTSAMPDGWTVNDDVLPSGIESIWNIDTKYGCAKATGYANSTKNVAKSWLISPAVTIGEGVFKVSECGNYFNSAENMLNYTTIKISTDGDTWTDLACTREVTGKAFTFVTSTADISSYVGKSVQVAFVYTSDADLAGTWEIESVTLK